MKKTIFYILFILTIGLIPCWLQYGCFMVTTDYLNQQVNFILETKRMLASGAPYWSWNTYFGDNFLADYGFYTWTSPFVWIDCLFPYEWMLFACTFTLYLKYIVLGCATWYYLRMMEIREELRTLGALMFTFSSYVVTCTGYYHFLEPIIGFVLLLLAIESFLHKERWSPVWLCLASCTVVSLNFYFAPCSFLPALIYAIARVTDERQLVSGSRIVLGLLLVFAGILMSAPVLLPVVSQLAGATRAQTHDFLSWQIADRIGSLFIPKVREGAVPLLSSSGNNGTATYIPVVGIFLAALYVWKRRDWLSVTLCILTISFLSPINSLFSLGTDPQYTRWVYALSFLFMFASVKYLNDNGQINKNALTCFVAITALVVVYRCWLLFWQPIRGFLPTIEVLFEHGLMLGYLGLCVCSLLIWYKWRNTQLLTILVALMSIVQVSAWSYLRTDSYAKLIDSRNVKLGMFDLYMGNNPFPRSTIQKTYRTDFITRQQPYYYANLPLQRNTPGISTYNSLYNPVNIKIGSVMDSVPGSFDHSHALFHTINQASFDALLSVREVVWYKDSLSTSEMNIPGSLIEENDSYRRYTTDNYIPFGFAYDRWMRQSVIDTLLAQKSKTDLPLLMLNALAIEDDDVSALSPYMVEMEDVTDTLCLADICAVRNRHTASNVEWTTRGFSCDVDGDSTMVWWFSALAEPGFTATIDGVETKIYPSNCSFSAIIVPAGSHHIVFDFFPPGLKLGLILMVIGMILLIMIVVYDRKSV